MKNYISENISYLVNKMRCSQDEFGAIFDLKRSVVSQYIKEKSQPRIETIQRICAHFQITIDDFINKSLEEVKNNIVNEPPAAYQINKHDENKIIVLLENTIKDKDKIIATLEEQVMYYRYPNEKSSGA